jgi:hypothetical protein
MNHIAKFTSLSLLPAAALVLALTSGTSAQMQQRQQPQTVGQGQQAERLREECIAKVRAIYPDRPDFSPMAIEKREDLVRSCIRDGGKVPGAN